MVEVSKETVEKIYKLVESVKIDGKLRKGTNETTKSVEKAEAQLVIAAEDISPKEIVMHLPVLCKEKNIPFVYVTSKSELGAAAGLPVSTSSIAIVNPGDAKKQLMVVIKDLETLEKSETKPAEKKEEPKAEEKPAKEEPKQEEKVAEAEKAEPEEVVEEKKEEKVEETPDEEVKEEEQPKEEPKEEAPVEEKPEEKVAEPPKEKKDE